MSRKKAQSRKAAGARVMPYRSYRGLLVFGALIVTGMMLGNVYLGIMRVRYGKEIQELKQEAAVLGSEVRDLRGSRASLTSLATIEERAIEMGMIYPRRLPRTLVVKVNPDEIPASWVSKGMEGQGVPASIESPSLAMVGGGE